MIYGAALLQHDLVYFIVVYKWLLEKWNINSTLNACMTAPNILLQTWFNLNLAWTNNHILCKMWEEITYLYPNFNSVWEWISNFIQHFIGHGITYPCWD